MKGTAEGLAWDDLGVGLEEVTRIAEALRIEETITEPARQWSETSGSARSHLEATWGGAGVDQHVVGEAGRASCSATSIVPSAPGGGDRLIVGEAEAGEDGESGARRLDVEVAAGDDGVVGRGSTPAISAAKALGLREALGRVRLAGEVAAAPCIWCDGDVPSRGPRHRP